MPWLKELVIQWVVFIQRTFEYIVISNFLNTLYAFIKSIDIFTHCLLQVFRSSLWTFQAIISVIAMECYIWTHSITLLCLRMMHHFLFTMHLMEHREGFHLNQSTFLNTTLHILDFECTSESLRTKHFSNKIPLGYRFPVSYNVLIRSPSFYSTISLDTIDSPKSEILLPPLTLR